MAPSVRSSASLVVIACILLFSSAAITAHNITKILEHYPEYGTFNHLLTETKLAKEINTRQSITVLVIRDDNMSPITSQPIESAKMIMSNHILLDYFDEIKMSKIKIVGNQLTTLFQSSGVASYDQGFLNVTRRKDEGVFFGSFVKGAPLDSHLDKYVMALPFNISVIEVSKPIIAPGLGAAASGPALPPPPPAAPAPAPPKKKVAPAPGPTEAEAPVEADAPTAEEADTPVSSPAPSTAPSPSPAAADEPADDQPASPLPKSSAGKALISSVVLLVSFVATL